MYIRLTFFNGITLLMMALTIGMIVRRLKGRLESNLPLAYYVVLVLYTRYYEGTFNQYWVFAGVVFALFLRFEFLARRFEKFMLAAEFTVFAYLLWRGVALVLG